MYVIEPVLLKSHYQKSQDPKRVNSNHWDVSRKHTDSMKKQNSALGFEVRASEINKTFSTILIQYMYHICGCEKIPTVLFLCLILY
jgi:hypothetical protein